MPAVGTPPGLPAISPYLTVSDIDKTSDFYERAFGFVTTMKMPGENGAPPMHAEFSFNDGLIMIGLNHGFAAGGDPPAKTNHPSAVNMYVYCGDVDALYQQAISAGARSKHAPEDMPWGDRACMVFDIDGHCWVFATHKGH